MPRLNRRLRWALPLALLAVALGAYVALRRGPSAADLVNLLPPGQTALAHLDVRALRQAGILDGLAGSRAAEEPDYAEFVKGTGFDYRSDLDTVVAAWDGEHTYLVLRGSFDWDRLRAYAAARQGACENGLCRMPSSRPNRTITFYPVRSNVMALAVSPDLYAATRITARKDVGKPNPVPTEPLWISVQPAALKGSTLLPTGTRLFASALASADQLQFTLGPQGSQFEAALQVTCRSPEQAQLLHNQLRTLTDFVQSMLRREKQSPSAADLTGVLTAGQFRHAERMVYATWPIQRSFFEALAKGAS